MEQKYINRLEELQLPEDIIERAKYSDCLGKLFDKLCDELSDGQTHALQYLVCLLWALYRDYLTAAMLNMVWQSFGSDMAETEKDALRCVYRKYTGCSQEVDTYDLDEITIQSTLIGILEHNKLTLRQCWFVVESCISWGALKLQERGLYKNNLEKAKRRQERLFLRILESVTGYWELSRSEFPYVNSNLRGLF